MNLGRRLISWIPNTITCCNLLAGCLAIVMSFHLRSTFAGHSGLTWFYFCICAAALVDFCDGLSARLLKAYSDLGKQLDSLSDLVSFGVAPGMLMLNIMLEQDHSLWLCGIALFIPVMGAMRLAIFNIDDTQSTEFKGLPIPANALFWMGVSAWIANHYYPGWLFMWVLIVLISLCMVSNIRMFSLKFKNLAFRDNVKRYAIIVACIVFFIFYRIEGLAWTILLYILLSIFSRKKTEEES